MLGAQGQQGLAGHMGHGPVWGDPPLQHAATPLQDILTGHFPFGHVFLTPTQTLALPSSLL